MRQDTLSADGVTADRMREIGFAFRNSQALMSAVELAVFGALAEGPLRLEDLRTKVGIAARGARDFFDTLVALGLLERDSDGCYRNAPDCDRYLDPKKPNFIGGELHH